ncbi:ornithine decarboxylase 1 [Galendromus occidentalis]|uniref:ornithine decarboxylase n=1 Tax=Galendromus occidentalis TaxID=34638 RepID=A0AAJ6VVS4_9ACAR|nr:ornithine decarboxylase 1 [Galendromus occidentalis]
MDVPYLDVWSSAGPDPVQLARSIVSCRKNEETAFYVIDLDDLSFKLKLWREVLPRIEPHYAVKCNFNKVILKALVGLGVGFDCASKNEMRLLLSLGADPSKIVYAHPIKCPTYIRFAKERGIYRMTFDNERELEKIRDHFPEALLILRLRVVEKDCYTMTDKFGCPLDNVPSVLDAMRRLGLNLHGFSFHVGSQSQEDGTSVRALRVCKDAEKIALDFGCAPKLIDIGGGFDCNRGKETSFRKIAETIGTECDSLFPASEGYEIISEPGTFFVGSACSVCAMIVGKRDLKGMTQLYLNESVYVSLHMALCGDSYIQLQPLSGSEIFEKHTVGEGLYPTRIYGVSLDGIDRIIPCWQLPEMEIGDWILLFNQGAYSETIETPFNMLESPDRYYRSSSSDVIEAVRDLCDPEATDRVS